jgi:hypothetical protein
MMMVAVAVVVVVVMNVCGGQSEGDIIGKEEGEKKDY